MNPRKPVNTLSNRELLEESAVILREISDTLAEFAPLLSLVRGMNGSGGPSYVQAAGLRRTLRKARADATRPEDYPAPGPGRG